MDKIIILSDIHGWKNTKWISNYTNLLSTKYEICLYDSCELAEASDTLSKKQAHEYFINRGIDQAVRNLQNREQNVKAILAFSVGGVIAWQALQRGLISDTLIAISSTRLRYENHKPACNIHLYFGEYDPYRPSEKWIDTMNVPTHLIAKAEHALYQDKSFVSDHWDMNLLNC